MGNPIRFSMRSFVLMLALAPLASAYEFPLSENSIRNAYFLGYDKNEDTQNFLKQYVQYPPMPKSGPHVAQVEIQTPYEQVVVHASRVPGSYSAQQAALDYRAKPGSFVVRVRIDLTPSYSNILSNSSDAGGVQMRANDFWRAFTVKLMQNGKEIRTRAVSGVPLYLEGYGNWGQGVLSGADIKVVYDPALVTSSSTSIIVLTPDGDKVITVFDLSKLQ